MAEEDAKKKPELLRNPSMARKQKSFHMRSFSQEPMLARHVSSMANYSFNPQGSCLPEGYVPPTQEEEDGFLRDAGQSARANLSLLKLTTFLAGTDLSKLCAKNVPRIVATKKKGLCDGKVAEKHEDYFQIPENVELLENGGHIFSFTCKKHADLTQHEFEMVEAIVNLSAFPDEAVENGAPFVNMHDEEQRTKYTYIVQKCAYVLPGVTTSTFTPKFVSSYAYQSNAQPKSSHIYDDVTLPNTFRFSKVIIRFIFSLTLQMKVSRISSSVLPKLSMLIGTTVDHGLILERTKRDITKADSTVKAKSVLLYTKVDGGLLCTNITVALQTSIPSVVASLVNSFGSMGLGEVGETAANTRQYLMKLAES